MYGKKYPMWKETRRRSFAGLMAVWLVLGVACSTPTDAIAPAMMPQTAVDAQACKAGEAVPCKCASGSSMGVCGSNGGAAQCECGIGSAGQPVSISTSKTTVFEAENHLAVTSKGVVASAWIGYSPDASGQGVEQVGYAISQDGGSIWSPAQLIPKDPLRPVITDPALTSDGTNLYLTWMGYVRGSDPALTNATMFVSRLLPGETSFGAPIVVSVAGLGDKPWMGVTKRGAIVVTYMSQSGGTRTLHFAKSTDQGLTWKDHTISQEFGNLIVPCIGPSSERAWALFVDFSDNMSLKVRWSDDDGDTWPDGNVTKMTNLPVSRPPDCIARANSVIAAFQYSSKQTSTTFAGDEYHVIRYDGKSPPVEVRADDQLGGKLVMLGTLVPEALPKALSLVYYAGDKEDSPNGRVRMTRSLDDGATWGPSIVVSPPMLFTTKRGVVSWLGDYIGASQFGNDILIAYADNSRPTPKLGANVTHIDFVKVARP
jgi:hypothetical protein